MSEQRIELPEITAETVSRIEQRVFTEIARDTSPSRTATARTGARRRRWMTGLGIAAAFVVGMVIAPTLIGIGQSGGGFSAADSAVGGRDADLALPESQSVSESSAGGSAAADGSVAPEREIIVTGSATLQTRDVAAAVREIADIAEARGGFVERTSVTAPRATDAESAASADGWISIRVPAQDLTEVISEIGESGTVLSSEIGKEDVTMTAIDLRARVDALQASVDRLRQLMAESGSLADLIDAEVALTDRQAELESYQQQLTTLEDRVALSSLDVHVISSGDTVAADPAGFADGLLTGWNGLIVTLNALVIAFGFLLPWLTLAGVVLLLVWIARRRRRVRTASGERDSLS